MARIAVVTTGITSHLNVAFELARRLQLGGHEVVFLAKRPKAAEAVTTQGFTYFVAPARAAGSLEPHAEPPALAALIDQQRPDLCIVQSELHDAILWLLGCGIEPLLIEADSVPRAVGVPPPNSTYIATGKWYDALVSAVLWRKLHLTRSLRRLVDDLRGRGPTARWRATAEAGDLTLREVASTHEWPLLFYPTLEYLHASAMELDFPAGQREGGGRIGPLVYRQRVADDRADTHRLRAFLASRAERPLVFCTMGSILNLPSFYARVIEAVEPMDLDLVLVGRELGRQVPDNVHVYEFVPQLDLLAHADLVIHHGGNATVNECIDAGVPMLVCSAARMDMNGLAARVTFHRLGLRKPLKATSNALRAAIAQLLDDTTYRGRVEALRERIAWYERDNVVLQRVDRALATRAALLARRTG